MQFKTEGRGAIKEEIKERKGMRDKEIKRKRDIWGSGWYKKRSSKYSNAEASSPLE
jgi:hypothetical protein